MKLLKSRFLILTAALMLSLQLAGCSKDKVKVTSAAVTNIDKGSGDFDRMLKICFNEPLKSKYYHRVKIVTYENVKIQGEGWLRPLASDPDNKCQLRNIYLYINKNSPPHAHDLIHDYVKPGNIKELLVQIYYDKPEGKEIPVDEKLFKDL